MAIRPFQDILPQNMLPLGFGCGSLMYTLDRTQSLRLLETAIDCGITYFDTARMYGYGQAEHILGSLIQRHRSRLIITSKAGIFPPNRSPLRRLASRGTRFLHQLLPQTKRFVKMPEVWTPRYSCFTTQDLRQSLETSLKALRTAYLDIFLMHESTQADIQTAELLHFLEGLKHEGKIRAYGTATSIENTIKIAESHPLLTSIVQIPNSIWDMNISRLPPNPDRLTITHSFLANRLRPLLIKLSSDDSLARDWYTKTSVDPCNPSAVAQLLLAHALRSNPSGLVLFSSSKPANITANVKLISQLDTNFARVDGLNAFVRACAGSQTTSLEGYRA
jgi:D-threo-aldose 1-dehydrogenase